jgi:hypothetical protein
MMQEYSLSLDLTSALALFLVLQEKDASAFSEVQAIDESLRAFLYDQLSIEEMEQPEKLYSRLHAECTRRSVENR